MPEKEQVTRVLGSLESLRRAKAGCVESIVGAVQRGLGQAKSPLLKQLTRSSDSVFANMHASMFDRARRSAWIRTNRSNVDVEAIRSTLTLDAVWPSSDVLTELIGSRQPQSVALAAIQSLGHLTRIEEQLQPKRLSIRGAA